MAASVTSHRTPGSALAWLVLLAALLVLILVGWFAAHSALNQPAEAPPALHLPAASNITTAPTLPEAAVAPRAAPLSRRARRPSGVPLDANPGATPDDFEVLSAAELDAISQAND